MEEDLNNKKEKLPFWQFLGVLKWLVFFNFKISVFGSISELITRIILNSGPLFNAYIFARLLDKIIKVASNSNSSLNEIFPLLGLLLGYNLIIAIIESIYSYSLRINRNAAQFKAPEVLYRQIYSLGIQTLENPGVVNKLQRCREMIRNINNDYESVVFFISRLITLFFALFVVLRIMPTIALIIFLSLMPELILNRIYMKKNWGLYRDETENRRRADWTLSSITETSNLQEIIITSARKYLSNIFRSFGDYFTKRDLKIVKEWESYGFICGLVSQSARMFGYFIILKNLFYKLISVGDVTFQMRSLDIFTDNLASASNSFGSLYERSLRINEVKEVFDMKPMVVDGLIELPKLLTPPDIRLENISFKYPNSDNDVIKDLSLHIKSGEKIAIVGENGAGKTTLVKLLARFYKVEKGEVLLGKENINNIKIDSWYQNLSVLFQDYNTYSVLTLKENIFLGESCEELDMEKIKMAAEKANASSFISSYKNGYEQVLSEKFKGGTRPSTGQWQKIAIARFFYRNSPVVVFDEPTASIDAVSEAEIFGQIYGFFKNKTVIIISHRFSTVRNADKIYVLDKGKIIESGNHKELMKLKGKYHKAFSIQAKGYK
jgi:ATP-binding cassette subfamily B protein